MGWLNSITPGLADRPASEDTLGFETYTRALARFLVHPDTEGGLTVSIEGDWGSGKSSFLVQLEKEIRRIGSLSSAAPLTVEFNPWRQAKEEELWAAFALTFTRKVAEQQPVGRRWLGYLRLLWLRFQWREGWADLLRMAAIVAALAIVAVLVPVVVQEKGWMAVGSVSKDLFPTPQTVNVAADSQKPVSKGGGGAGKETGDVWKKIFDWGVVSGGVAGYAAVILSLWVRLLTFIKKPLKFELKTHLSGPDYAGRAAFVERFHEDFDKVVKAFAGRRRVYVFIDDLDRCDPGRAAELMQALNLMVSTNPQTIFILAMDRAKVSAGLADRQKGVLQYMVRQGSGSQGSLDAEIDRQRALEFGYQFVDKFVQLPFVVPRPAAGSVESFLLRRAFAPAEESGTIPSQPSRLSKRLHRPAGAVSESGTSQDDSARVASSAMDSAGEESCFEAAPERIFEVTRTVSIAFVRNPRRIKQFVNIFRLRAYIAEQTGLLAQPGVDTTGFTLQQLGKFTALMMGWPLLAYDILGDATFIGKIEELALISDLSANDSSVAARRLRHDESLRLLLRAGCVDADGLPLLEQELWSLKNIDLTRLFEISHPATRSIGTP
jgi:hypothetical protein